MRGDSDHNTLIHPVPKSIAIVDLDVRRTRCCFLKKCVLSKAAIIDSRMGSIWSNWVRVKVELANRMDPLSSTQSIPLVLSFHNILCPLEKE